jgi:hypothetical protein
MLTEYNLFFRRNNRYTLENAADSQKGGTYYAYTELVTVSSLIGEANVVLTC